MAINLIEAIEASKAAKQRFIDTEGEPLFLGDWARTAFIHYEVDAAALQRVVPFQLDLFKGRAFISLVAFTQRHLRPRIGGRVAALALAPIATHRFLNLRTYVRVNDEPGIYFLAEWLSNRLSVFLGPPIYGLPYRFGRLNYRHDHENHRLFGKIETGDSSERLIYRADWDSSTKFNPCLSGSVEEFLMERYTAFTSKGKRARLFRVWHEPWPQTSIEVTIEDDSLIATKERWFGRSRLIGANYSPGVRNVWIGRPQRLCLPLR